MHNPIVISGPSGVGKGTLIKMLLEKFPNLFQLSVSLTTRAPRGTEKNGVEYLFVSKEDFNQEISKHSFLEYCEVHGNFYGTHKGQVKEIMEKGKICIMEIDVQGAEKIKNSGLPINTLFITPPDMETLKERLTGRGTDAPEAIAKRLKNAEGELKVSKESKVYDHFLVNGVLEKTWEDLIGMINKLYGLELKL